MIVVTIFPWMKPRHFKVAIVSAALFVSVCFEDSLWCGVRKPFAADYPAIQDD
jgi:hypothetical protein